MEINMTGSFRDVFPETNIAIIIEVEKDGKASITTIHPNEIFDDWLLDYEKSTFKGIMKKELRATIKLIGIELSGRRYIDPRLN